MPPADRAISRCQTDTFELSFPPSDEAVGPARRRFSAWLHRRTDDDVADELEVVFSELATNAVNGSPPGAEEVTGRAWYEGETLVVDITNRIDPAGSPGPAGSCWDLQDPLRTGGRGLVIAEAFVDSMEVTLEPGQRLVVRCRRRLG